MTLVRPRPRISVVICAYTEDRWDDILAAVASVRDQSWPAEETLLVVDHNPALLRRLRDHYEGARAGEGVRVLANAGPRGLSAGRNTGIAASTGEVIAFLDDDAVAERDWLRHFADGYADPLVLAVGGRTEPVWASRRRPAWFPEEFDWVVGCTYRGLPPGRVRVRNVLGGNASFRREAFDAVGGFASGIGRDADKRPLGCEETELCIRLARARPDAVLLIDDRAVIHHKVPAARERFAYFRSRAYAEGLSKALVARSVGARGPGLGDPSRRYTTRGGDRAPLHHPGAARGRRPGAAGRPARPGGRGRARGRDRGRCVGRGGRLSDRHRPGPPRRRAPLHHCGGAGPFGVRRRPGRLPVTTGPVPILMYHAVAHTPARATHALSVSPGAFAEQMGLLGASSFTPVTCARLADAWRGGDALPPNPVLITFDDGYEGVHRHALPVLDRHGFAATLFASTGWLRGRYETDGALDVMLDWGQVRELAAAGMEIGGSQPYPSAARPARRRAAPLRGGALPGHPRGRAGPSAGVVRLSLRLLRPPGPAGGAGGRVRSVARGGQRAGGPPPGAVRAAAGDGASQDPHRGVRAAGPRPGRRPRLRRGPGAHQGLCPRPQITSASREGALSPCPTRPPGPRPPPRRGRPRSSRRRPAPAAAVSCSATPMR
ncbi:succinoglycan biosynthesis protein [Streptomyces himastatinicus ATCC 53653]|uniref:Succinoglycan biosynthesis protein n=1 Tax=Streptomyces himastatinicus ATCC 53653 TaxID=457427 RepID=D9WEY3_9ACTN|nr:succinoglycan biosynthesis protein [Streptomyces himastatinicus ATCC 53653]